MRTISLLTVVIGFLCLAAYGWAEPETTTVAKNLTGEVGGYASNMIAVVYQRDAETRSENEILFTYDRASTALVQANSWNDIDIGDTVTIEYDEISTVGKDGPHVSDRKVTTIKFVKPAVGKKSDPALVSEP